MFIAEVVTFDTPTSTGTQTINLSNASWSAENQPKLVLFQTNNVASTGTGTGVVHCLGAETRSGLRFGNYVACVDNANLTTNAPTRGSSETYSLNVVRHTGNGSGSIDIRANITTWNNTSFVLTYANVKATAAKCSALVFGGSDFEGTLNIWRMSGFPALSPLTWRSSFSQKVMGFLAACTSK